MAGHHQGHDGKKEHQEICARSNEIARLLIDAGLKVHRTLGPGLLESVYEACLERELQLRGMEVQRQVALPVSYEGLKLEAGYRLDLWVERSVIIEVKAIETLTALHKAQLLTYLRLSGCRLGLLMNFNTTLFKNGLQRLVL